MLIKLSILFILSIITPAYAYIDPATGNAFFTLAITIVSAILFGLQYIYEHVFMVKGIFQKNKKRIPLLLYSEGNTYWPWFEPILEELENRKIHTQFYTSSQDDMCFNKDYKYIHPTFIGKGNKAYAKMAFVKADIVLMTTPGLDVYQLKRSKNVKKYVHFYHGLDDACGYRLFGTDYYDTLLIHNDINIKYIRELEVKRNLPPKEIVIVGDIRLDELNKRVSTLDTFIQKNTPKTILLASSWGKEAVLYKYGSQIIDKLLATDYHIIIRPHPQMRIDNPQLLDELLEKYPNQERLEWDFKRDNLPSMQKSDVMISDFSGIIYEYSFIFNKPVITTTQEVNTEIYDISDLDEPTWEYELKGALGAELNKDNIDNIKEILDKVIQEKNVDHIRSFAKKYWQNQNKCISSIIDYIENSLKSPHK